MAQKNQTKSNYYEVYGSKMHVLEYGKEEEGNPILFLEGNPYNSFLWRNITSYLEGTEHHIIVPDLIGMGKSDKPAIDYTFIEQYTYVEKLIEQLELKNIILVLHDWGSGLGFHYFARHAKNVKGIVFMEGIIQDIGTFFPKENIAFFNKLRGSEGYKMIAEDNIFLNDVLPTWVSRELTEEELYELMELMKGVGKYDLSQLTEEDLIYLLEIIAKRKASSLTKQDLKKTNNPDRK